MHTHIRTNTHTLFHTHKYKGKSRPKRGDVNCKSRDKRVEKMAYVGVGLYESACYVYVEHNHKLERGL